MTCGKGAYVRAIARDLGVALGCLAHVAALRRTEVGGFNVGNAVSLDALARIVEDDTLPQVLVPMTTALAGIPALAVTEPQALRLRSGQSVRMTPALVGDEAGEAATVRAMRAGELIALARLEGMELSPVRVFQPWPDADRKPTNDHHRRTQAVDHHRLRHPRGRHWLARGPGGDPDRSHPQPHRASEGAPEGLRLAPRPA